jgi:hypothetical protein
LLAESLLLSCSSRCCPDLIVAVDGLIGLGMAVAIAGALIFLTWGVALGPFFHLRALLRQGKVAII